MASNAPSSIPHDIAALPPRYLGQGARTLPQKWRTKKVQHWGFQFWVCNCQILFFLRNPKIQDCDLLRASVSHTLINTQKLELLKKKATFDLLVMVLRARTLKLFQYKIPLQSPKYTKSYDIRGIIKSRPIRTRDLS